MIIHTVKKSQALVRHLDQTECVPRTIILISDIKRNGYWRKVAAEK